MRVGLCMSMLRLPKLPVRGTSKTSFRTHIIPLIIQNK